MKNRLFLLTLTSILSLIIVLHGSAQEPQKEATLELNTDVFQEQISLITDRTLYAVGEEIKIRANYFPSEDLNQKAWSTVLYVELIKPDGTSVAQQKFSLSNAGAKGEIVIPQQLLTGVYYLKGYTKWMRNFPVEEYAYNQLKIINPKKSRLLHSEIKEEEKLDLTPYKTDENPKLSIAVSKDKFSTREEGLVSITTSDIYYRDYTYSVSIVKKETNELDPLITKTNNPVEHKVATYLPEINGISIGGKVVDAKSNNPVENARVNLSLLNHQSHFSGFNTNKNGEFYFTFPYSEYLHDFFISAAKDSMELTLNIDNDFCQRPLSLDNPEFVLSENEKIIAEEISINAQLFSQFKPHSHKDTIGESEEPRKSFYGTPDKVFYTKKYIDLPNLEEFIFELITELNVIRTKGVPNIHSATWNVFHNYPFLVMVDNVPISNTADFLELKTNTIDRIEVINKSYLAGNMKYSGIINAFSKKEDMGGINLPDNSMFFSFEMFSVAEKDNSIIPANNRIPDLRNCLLWAPNVEINNNSGNSIEFKTADTKGEYEIIVWSVPKDGRAKTITKKSFSVE